MWCTYCKKDTHNDAECWSTRPGGWKPYRGVDVTCKHSPPLVLLSGQVAVSGQAGLYVCPWCKIETLETKLAIAEALLTRSANAPMSDWSSSNQAIIDHVRDRDK